MKIAVDIEETVADVDGAMLEAWNFRYGTDYEKSDMDSWDWVREELEYWRFMQLVDDLWVHAAHTIEMLDVAAPTVLRKMVDEGHGVDFVTARTGVETQMQRWLKRNGFESAYFGFVSIEPEESKAELDYEVFIDDNPRLTEELYDYQHQYLIERSYNYGKRVEIETESAENHELVTPVGNVTEAALRILS